MSSFGGFLLLFTHRFPGGANRAFQSLKLPWRSTHILRHSFATQALIVTRDLSAVQASLGHTDQQVTQKYAKTVALLESNTGEKVADFLKIK